VSGTSLVWKDIIGYEGLYQVSSLGEIRSIDRIVTYHRKNGTIFKQKRNGKTITPATHKGYKLFGIHKEGNSKTVYVHRIMMETFFPLDSYEGMCVNHKNGVKHENNILNLEWVTYKRNTDHFWNELDHGKHERGKKITDSEIVAMLEMFIVGEKLNDISINSKVTACTISQIINEKSHVYIRNKYKYLFNLVIQEREDRKISKSDRWARDNWEILTEPFRLGISVLNLSKTMKIPTNWVSSGFVIVSKKNPDLVKERESNKELIKSTSIKSYYEKKMKDRGVNKEEVLASYKDGLGVSLLAKKNNVSYSTINRIIKNN
jgi:hypothetical protein